VIIGGGCGVAPMKGIIEYLIKNRNDYKDVYLFLGYRTPDHILFKNELPEWKKLFKANISVDKNPENACFDGYVGFVTNLLKESNINNENKIVFICGPPMMMKIGIDILKQKGFHDDQIYLSMERLMNCGIGVCGHCMIHGKYTCKDGPVFRYDEIKGYKND
jgi:NAD(P)H-flavin reductase